MSSVAHRLHTVEEYYFSRKLKEVRALLTDGKPIINLGIGSPDLPPPPQVVEALNTSLSDVTAHKYQSYQGLPELRMAISDFYKKNYDVELNSESEILPLMGSKEGIMHISMAYLNEGDAVLIPNPGYPTYSSVTKLMGATPIFYDLKYESQWQPNLDELSKMDLSKVKLMWVNYPHMPTGTKASKLHLSALIQFAKAHNILLINDNPYSFILNDNPTSIFNFEGAKDVCLELNSLSKSFNMAGWRVGMLSGAARHIENVIKVKSNMDSGMFYGVQKGAVEALKSSTQWFKELNAVYEKRRQLVWQLATQLGCDFDKKTSGMFVWAKLPLGIDSEEFIDELLYKKNIFIAPGTIFGSNGNGYVRFSLCASEKSINEAIKRTV
ncbi:MAG: aminotransferase class I/II-fold pyridoxal phosphate-dependent enzyme [Bacteroidetes bacterium]|nr:aminotransferase class I/II-fold pyridoxal phosphate-dependent enzyme [Bacteroidota bacterium]MDA0860560.1 aminotransferase class I/II-fold pyridoxal phosphate-dependent enzyme [Bacteroidota bacterium]MDA1318324.1 aminotransferase class I/II-fold pyridoxal phosphate-dependent enzyme [Bacteroidota bacterium]